MPKNLVLLTLLMTFASQVSAVMEIVVQPEEESYIYDYKYTTGQISAEKPVSLGGILNSISEINIASKGFSAILNDISINGGTFEQTAVLLDGVKVNDSQTGHFNLDVPVPSIYIGGLTILKNGSSSIGAGGFTGLVNIETPQYDKDLIKSYFEYGTYNTIYSGLLFTRKFSDLIVNLSAESDSSDGYHADTDFYKNTAMVDLKYGKLCAVKFGYDEKSYGAYDFYSPGSNLDSWEYTATKYGSLDLFKGEALSGDAYYRSHYDHFILKRSNPAYYENRHNTAVYGADLKYDWKINSDNSLAAKYNFQREEMQSKNLGNHYRVKNMAVVNAYLKPIDDLVSNINLSMENYDVYRGVDLLPSASFVYSFMPHIKFNAGYSYSVRYPDFTELYYNDSKSIGNPGLKAEKCNEYSGGMEMKLAGSKLRLSAFYRNAYDLIDWGKNNIAEPKWTIKNIGSVNTAGYSAGVEVPFEWANLSASYTYLDSYRSESFISKYGVAYLRNKVTASADFEVFTVKVKADYTFKNYINRSKFCNSLDITLSRTIVEGIDLSLKAENALNWYFEETPGIPAVGRMLSVRVEAQI